MISIKHAETELVLAFIGLGSNLENPEAQIQSAHRAIADLDGVEELAFSGLYQSVPMGPKDQPDYINAVMAVKTSLPPQVFLRCLQSIEHQQGRVRDGQRWGARTLDLDLLIYGDQQIQTPDLTVPHPGIAERAFVLYPLHELTSQIQVPGMGKITDLLEKCPASGLKRLN
ncbi:MAG: 2-amino-4-hydroxy-6-hydroxymethyldihydropteridine diphosphokinase [Methylococcaceae bacterium]|nr:2-amino-4-hydroxy-6-hydroxymethyldihydropteridine diphosphokinase [Methylococcaceae bacterium]